MPTLAGWLTGTQVPQEMIDQTLTTMGDLLGRHGGQLARTIQSGMGLIAFSDPSYAMQHNDDPPVLDWVPDRRTLVYRRPLSGAHPLYYVENWPAQGNLLFASEIRALLEVGVPRRLHLAALDALLRYGFIPAPWTAFKDIRVVPAGSILRWQRTKVVVNPATDYRLDEPLNIKDVHEQLQTVLNEATQGILPPHDQLVALTGGETPSALTALLAAQHTTSPFTIATLGYTKRATTKGWKQAEQIANACQHPFLEISGVDQPEFWIATLAGSETPSIDTRPVAMHQLLHTTAAETGARVAISGLGASILTGPMASLASKMPQKNLLAFYSQAQTGQVETEISPLWSQVVAKALRKEERWEDTLHARKLARRAEQFKDKRQGWYYLDLHLRLPDKIVQTAQQLATQEQLVVRSPYLTTPVMDLLTRLPAPLNDGPAKSMLLAELKQRLLPEDAKSSASLPLLAPLASLRHVEGSELLQQLLSPVAIKATGLFNPEVVARLLEHQDDKRAEQELLLVFTTQLLSQLFGIEASCYVTA
jgi:asparagine synthase (glutamine-hydrolysing)